MSLYEQGLATSVYLLEKMAEDNSLGSIPVGAMGAFNPLIGGLGSGLTAPKGQGLKRGLGVTGAGLLGGTPGYALLAASNGDPRIMVAAGLLAAAGSGVGSGLAQRYFLKKYKE